MSDWPIEPRDLAARIWFERVGRAHRARPLGDPTLVDLFHELLVTSAFGAGARLCPSADRSEDRVRSRPQAALWAEIGEELGVGPPPATVTAYLEAVDAARAQAPESSSRD